MLHFLCDKKLNIYMNGIFIQIIKSRDEEREKKRETEKMNIC